MITHLSCQNNFFFKMTNKKSDSWWGVREEEFEGKFTMLINLIV